MESPRAPFWILCCLKCNVHAACLSVIEMFIFLNRVHRVDGLHHGEQISKRKEKLSVSNKLFLSEAIQPFHIPSH